MRMIHIRKKADKAKKTAVYKKGYVYCEGNTCIRYKTFTVNIKIGKVSGLGSRIIMLYLYY